MVRQRSLPAMLAGWTLSSRAIEQMRWPRGRKTTRRQRGARTIRRKQCGAHDWAGSLKPLWETTRSNLSGKKQEKLTHRADFVRSRRRYPGVRGHYDVAHAIEGSSLSFAAATCALA